MQGGSTGPFLKESIKVEKKGDYWMQSLLFYSWEGRGGMEGRGDPMGVDPPLHTHTHTYQWHHCHKTTKLRIQRRLISGLHACFSVT